MSYSLPIFAKNTNLKLIYETQHFMGYYLAFGKCVNYSKCTKRSARTVLGQRHFGGFVIQ